MIETQTQYRILVVDDEPHQIDTVCRGLFLHGYECRGARSATEALDTLETGGPFHLMLTDLTMPSLSGVDLITAVRERCPDLPIVVFTGLVSTEEIDEVKRLGIPILQKPFEPDTLVDAIEKRLREAADPSPAKENDSV